MSGMVVVGEKEAILTVAVSSRALFMLEEENRVFEKEGERAFNALMRDRKQDVLEPGVAFALVRKMLNLNIGGVPRIQVVMLSRNSPAAGLRVMNSVRAHGLAIERAVFCSGGHRFGYVQALGTDLFLSANAKDVEAAVRNGVAGATLFPCVGADSDDKQVRIAFDGDSVLFGSSGDRMFKEVGKERWSQHEVDNAGVPLEAGPFKSVIERLHRVRESLGPEHSHMLRLALITARGAPTHERAMNTLELWGVEMDDAVYANGMAKGPFVSSFQADVFFDDVLRNIESATRCNVAGAAHVPSEVEGHGIAA